MTNSPLNKVSLDRLADFLINRKHLTTDDVADYGNKINMIEDILERGWEWECLDYVAKK